MCSHLSLNLPIGGVYVFAITFMFAITLMNICLLHCRVRLLQVRLSLWLSTVPRRNMEAWRHSILPCPLHPGTKSRWLRRVGGCVGSGTCLEGLQTRNTFIFVGNRATVCQSSSHYADTYTTCSRYGCVGVRLLNRCLYNILVHVRLTFPRW
jgi:hypothetical protein